MAGLVPAIHVVFGLGEARTWMPGTRPGMTSFVGKPNSISCILSQTLRMKSTKHSWLICPTRCFAICLSTPVSKNIPLRVLVDAALLIPLSHPTEGRIAIVTNAGRDAVDVAVSLTNGICADGEVVWS
jgi:hypothetical protein